MPPTRTFRLPPGTDLASCADKRRGGRFTLMESKVILTQDAAGAAYLLATDGTVAACVAVTLDGPPLAKPMALPSAPLRAGTKELTITLDGRELRAAGAKTSIHPLPEQEGMFPSMGSPFPSAANLVNQEAYEAHPINAARLADIARAISHNGLVSLWLPKHPHLPAVVIGKNGAGCMMLSTDADLGQSTPELAETYRRCLAAMPAGRLTLKPETEPAPIAPGTGRIISSPATH